MVMMPSAGTDRRCRRGPHPLAGGRCRVERKVRGTRGRRLKAALREERVARVLVEARSSAQGRPPGELREGEDAHCFERCVGRADVGQSAQLERRVAEPD
jgi:hypothetical protein